MKKYLLILFALVVLMPMLFAQTDCGECKDGQVMVYKMDKQVTENGQTQVQITTTQMQPSSKVYFGIFAEDFDSEMADEMDYEYSFGVLITKVVENTPAAEAGIQDGDIIMEIDGEPLDNKEEFDSIRADLEPGDEVTLLMWRSGEEFDIDMTMQARPEESTIPTMGMKEIEIEKSNKLSAGYGGGTWTPVWFMPEVDDVNALLGGLGFDPISDKGMFMNGGAGKGAVGNGLFIGGFGASYEKSMEQANVVNPIFKDYLTYTSTFGGVTLDKRIPFTRSIIGSIGLMLGAGDHTVQITSTDGNYAWPPASISSPNNYSATISRTYLAVQPRAELMFRLLSWLAIRAEVGYIYGYAPKEGWQVTTPNGNEFQMAGSPDTPFQGMTFSVGPWFGF